MAIRTNNRLDLVAALPTAFRENGTVDYDGCARIADRAAVAGVDGVFILGTTGEFPTLATRERTKIAEVCLDAVGERTRVIVHVGASSALESTVLAEAAFASGAKEIAIITPYYYRVEPREIVTHFKRVIDASRGNKVFAYGYRELASNALSQDIIASLADYPEFAGAKISGESIPTIQELATHSERSLDMLSGNDLDIPKATHLLTGVVSGLSSVFASSFMALRDASASGDSVGLRAWENSVQEISEILQGKISKIKEALSLLGLCEPTTRAAMASVSDTERDQIRGLLARLNTLA